MSFQPSDDVLILRAASSRVFWVLPPSQLPAYSPARFSIKYPSRFVSFRESGLGGLRESDPNLGGSGSAVVERFARL